jgi:hypothetical protein
MTVKIGHLGRIRLTGADLERLRRVDGNKRLNFRLTHYPKYLTCTSCCLLFSSSSKLGTANASGRMPSSK